MKPPETIRLTPGKRVLFLTKDPVLIERQLAGELDLRMADLSVDDLLDDINTDAMTPAWVCFSHRPEDIARDAYAGLIVDGRRLFPRDALRDGGFEAIVSGYRKGVGSSRETATQCEVWSGIRLAVAASFAPIHARNNVNQGLLMADHDTLARLEAGEGVPLEEFTRGYDRISQLVIRQGGLFPFSKALAAGEIPLPEPETGPRPMTMAEKLLARHLLAPAEQVEDGAESGADSATGADSAPVRFVKPGDAVVVTVDGGYSHEFTTAQVHHFLEQEYGPDYTIKDPERFAVFEDHLIYADEVPKMRAFTEKIDTLRDLQREFQRHAGTQDFSAKDRVSPGICHEVAREYLVDPGDFIQATDSHTCMGGVNNALAWGVGATEYANLIHSGFTMVEVPESIRFELEGELPAGVTAKDLMLYVLLEYARPQKTLDRVMEFTGPGVSRMSMDERATLTNMATECAAKTAIVVADEETFRWLGHWRPEADLERYRRRAVAPDPDAEYAGGVHTIDLSKMRPMVAHPGDPDRGIPSDPTNGAWVDEVGDVEVEIAYGGSCTAGKIDDLEFYHRVVKEAVEAGLTVHPRVRFLIQFGSQAVEEHCRRNGMIETFERAGVQLIQPGCGACIGCGPGVSEEADQVTISAINRNYKGRSGPGRLYLASPLTVAASAFTGKITAYEQGMFARELVPA